MLGVQPNLKSKLIPRTAWFDLLIRLIVWCEFYKIFGVWHSIHEPTSLYWLSVVLESYYAKNFDFCTCMNSTRIHWKYTSIGFWVIYLLSAYPVSLESKLSFDGNLGSLTLKLGSRTCMLTNFSHTWCHEISLQTDSILNSVCPLYFCEIYAYCWLLNLIKMKMLIWFLNWE